MRKLLLLSVVFLCMNIFSNHVHAYENAKTKETTLRVVHASPDAPAVDIKVDGKVLLKGVKFKDVSKKLMVTPGKHTIEICLNSVTKDNKPILSKVVMVEEGKSYTAVAANQASNLDVVVFEDIQCKADGKAHIRLGHFSPNAPAVDVGLKGKDAVFSNLSYKQVTDCKALPEGTYDLEVRLAGTKNVALDLSGTAIKGNTMYTVLAVGLAGGNPPLSVIVLEDACQ